MCALVADQFCKEISNGSDLIASSLTVKKKNMTNQTDMIKHPFDLAKGK